jgi:hypothetical protein
MLPDRHALLRQRHLLRAGQFLLRGQRRAEVRPELSPWLTPERSRRKHRIGSLLASATTTGAGSPFAPGNVEFVGCCANRTTPDDVLPPLAR